MSVDRWMNKENVIHKHTHNGILLSHKNGGNIAICYNMNEPGGLCAKWNKSERERQVLYGISYICNLKKEKADIEIESRMVAGMVVNALYILFLKSTTPSSWKQSPFLLSRIFVILMLTFKPTTHLYWFLKVWSKCRLTVVRTGKRVYSCIIC